VLSRRVPGHRALGPETPTDALAISLDEKRRGGLGRVAELPGTDIGAAAPN